MDEATEGAEAVRCRTPQPHAVARAYSTAVQYGWRYCMFAPCKCNTSMDEATRGAEAARCHTY